MKFAGRATFFAAIFFLAVGPVSGQSQAPEATAAQPQAAPPPAEAATPPQAASDAPAQSQTPTVAGGTLRGKVVSGPEKNAVPLPGVSVTATNSLTGEKYATVTDAAGNFAMQVPKDGRYVVRTELAGFAVGTKSVVLNAENRAATVTVGMELASRVQAGGGEVIAGATALGMSGRGTQALTLQGGAGGALAAGIGGGNQPALPTASQSDTGSDAVAISGAAGSTSAAFNFDAARQSMEDQRDLQRSTEARGGSGPNYSGAQGYGILMGGRGGFFGGGAGGRRLNLNAIHGSIVYQVTNSALNAKDFSVTGQPTTQPGYGTSRYGFVYSGPLIPKLLETKTDFLFIAAVGNHGSSLFDQSSIVPTAAERAGDFSGLTDPTNNNAPLQLYNPYTGNPYPNNNITDCAGPGCGISPIAAALLPYIPLPNQAQLTPSSPNYRLLESQQTNTDQMNVRYVHNFGGGARGPVMFGPGGMMGSGSKSLSQNINANFSFQHTSEDEVTLFPAFGGKDQLYQSVISVGYNLSRNNWTNTLTGSWNRTDSEARNYFTGKDDVAGNAGILGVGLTPFFYGLPSLSFSGYAGGAEQQPSSRIQEVGQASENFTYLHKDHNVRVGGDVRRIFLDVEGGVQGTGQYTFSGFATEQPTASVASGTTGSQGNSFADFLIGIPQQGKLQEPCTAGVAAGLCDIGPPIYYLRQNEFSLYAQDTWHAQPTLTLLYGLRYEYFSPFAEQHDRIADLDPNADFTDVAVVTPNAIGPFGGRYTHALINPFRDGWAPRVGFAWKAARNTVVRGGYGINYNTSVYGNFVQDLAYQRPFAIANNNTQSGVTAPTAASYFTLTNGLTDVGATTCGAPPCITNNYAVDKNYRMGYVQGYNLDIQQTLGKGYVLNVGYNGSKGTHLDGLLAPNRIFGYGPSTPNAQVFDYEVSHAQSNFNALAVRLRKRLQNGIAVGATYTYSHSIDDASVIGGANGVVAQEPTNLIDDMGNSSFDQRHVLKGDFTYELPFGPQGKLLSSGDWMSHALNGLQFAGNFQFATGEPLNPFYEAAANEVATGVTSSLRPDRIYGSSLEGGLSQLQEWFNVHAFTPLNAAAVTGYGTAGRNSIPGPGVREFDASFSKYVELGGTRSIEFRVQANNVFNVVQYNSVSTAIDSYNAGKVLAAAAMRNMLMLARYRF